MEYIYAALLLDSAGKEITESSLEGIVKAAGITPNEAMAKAVVNSLKGVNIKDVIKNAQSMQAAAPVASAASAGKAEAKKEEKEEKQTEEQAAGGLASLFG